MELVPSFHLPSLISIISIITINITIFITIILFRAKNPKKINNISNKYKNKSLPQPAGALPLIGHLHLLENRATLARTLGVMAKTCGPIFSLKLGQHKVIVISGWEMVKDCFTNNDMVTATRPSMAVSKYLAYDYASFSISPYGRYWREIRKISTVELWSTKRLEKMKHVLASEVNSCLKNLYFECTKNLSCNSTAKICLGKWLEYMTFNVALSMIVGKRFPPESYDESRTFASRFKKAIGRATHLAGIPVPSDFIPWIERLDFGGYISSMKETHEEIDVIIGCWLDEHVQRRKGWQGVMSLEDKDFMDVMLSNIAQGYAMSGYTREIIIKATALTLLLTGSESTSITLIWAISLLLNNPKALKSAQQELDHKVGKKRWVENSDITNLPYLQAIVKETLRLYPPSPLTGPREATEDCHVDGHHIPKGARLLVNIWKLHRDPRIWPEPDQFRPERFLEEKKDVDFRGQHFEYIPFSLGRRSCPGMNFGLQMVQLTLARLVQGFDMWTVDGSPIDMSEGLGLALTKSVPLVAVLTPRLPTQLYTAL